MYKLIYHCEIQSCDDVIVQVMKQRPSRSLQQQCGSRAVCGWMLLSGSNHLTHSLLTEQTMCPDVFRGPWGGSHCRDSPVQTIRDCNCAQGTRTHVPHMYGSLRSCLLWANPWSVMQNTQLYQYCVLKSNEIPIKNIYNLHGHKLCFLKKTLLNKTFRFTNCKFTS